MNYPLVKQQGLSTGKISSVSTVQKTLGYSNVINFLFLFFAAYLVLPIIEVPLLGLSLSAPVFFVIALTCILKPPRPWFRAYRGWILAAILIWAGIFISTTANGLLSGGVDLGSRGLITVVRYLYWLLVFVITAYFASQRDVIRRIGPVLGWSVLGLALLRWLEVALYGNLGGWTGTVFMTQNTYGFLFSCFSPFLLIMVFGQRGIKRLLAWGGNLVLWGAAAINGSRGSWIAIVVGIGLCLFLLFTTQPRKFTGMMVIVIITLTLGSVLWAAFPKASQAVLERFETFESLDKEKSYLIRELMFQKGLQLFSESPIIGVGASRFTEEVIPLEIPRILSYGSQEFFNEKSAHNSYIAYLAENGLVGAIPFGIFLLVLFLRGGNATIVSLRKHTYWVLPVYLGFLQMCIHMWAINALTTTSSWFIYGLTAATIAYHWKTR